jgi:hypothetical protein
MTGNSKAKYVQGIDGVIEKQKYNKIILILFIAFG